MFSGTFSFINTLLFFSVDNFFGDSTYILAKYFTNVNKVVRGYCTVAIMSFSSLVQDLSFRDANDARRPRPAAPGSSASTMDDRRSHVSRAMSYASTAATSVSISGDISSQLHGGYSHPLARSWQAERQLTKVLIPSAFPLLPINHKELC